MIHSGMTNNDKDYEICMRAENVYLPSSGHFGVSAATGGLADDHDVSLGGISRLQVAMFMMSCSYMSGWLPVLFICFFLGYFFKCFVIFSKDFCHISVHLFSKHVPTKLSSYKNIWVAFSFIWEGYVVKLYTSGFYSASFSMLLSQLCTHMVVLFFSDSMQCHHKPNFSLLVSH